MSAQENENRRTRDQSSPPQILPSHSEDWKNQQCLQFLPDQLHSILYPTQFSNNTNIYTNGEDDEASHKVLACLRDKIPRNLRELSESFIDEPIKQSGIDYLSAMPSIAASPSLAATPSSYAELELNVSLDSTNQVEYQYNSKLSSRKMPSTSHLKINPTTTTLNLSNQTSCSLPHHGLRITVKPRIPLSEEKNESGFAPLFVSTNNNNIEVLRITEQEEESLLDYPFEPPASAFSIQDNFQEKKPESQPRTSNLSCLSLSDNRPNSQFQIEVPSNDSSLFFQTSDDSTSLHVRSVTQVVNSSAVPTRNSSSKFRSSSSTRTQSTTSIHLQTSRKSSQPHFQESNISRLSSQIKVKAVKPSLIASSRAPVLTTRTQCTISNYESITSAAAIAACSFFQKERLPPSSLMSFGQKNLNSFDYEQLIQKRPSIAIVNIKPHSTTTSAVTSPSRRTLTETTLCRINQAGSPKSANYSKLASAAAEKISNKDDTFASVRVYQQPPPPSQYSKQNPSYLAQKISMLSSYKHELENNPSVKHMQKSTQPIKQSSLKQILRDSSIKQSHIGGAFQTKNYQQQASFNNPLPFSIKQIPTTSARLI